MTKNSTLSEVIKSLPEYKKKSDPLWTRFVLRPLSFVGAWIFLKLNFSANTVTYLSILFSLVGFGLMITGQYVYIITGAICFNLFSLFDCIDGNIARLQKSDSEYGEWVDALGGYITYSVLFLAAGIAAEKTGSFDFNLIIAGAVAAITNLLMRVEYHKFREIKQDLHSKKEENGSRVSLQKVISSNLGITGILMPLIFLGSVFEFLDWLVLFYAVVYTLFWCGLTIKYLIKIEFGY